MSEARFPPDAGPSRVADRLGGARSVQDVVAILRDTTREIAGSDGIAVILREGECCFYAAEDAIEPLWRGRRFPLTACISGWAMLNDETAIVPDIEFDRRVPVEAYRATSMRSLVMVPIGSPRPIAALGAYWCTTVVPDAATIRRLETLARLAATALARATTAAKPDRPPVMPSRQPVPGQPPG